MDGNSVIPLVLSLAVLVSLAGVIYPFAPFKSRWVALASSIGCFVLIGVTGPSPDTARLNVKEHPRAVPEGEKRRWVTSERLNRRTCPSERCGVVGQLFFREGVKVHEVRDGWARITPFYDASCLGGRSEYVDSGNTECDDLNGIVDGQLAEWVSLGYLSETRPADLASAASGIEALIAGSDDFARYRTAFANAAKSLIAQRQCSEGDFRDMGGWVKSTHHGDQAIYYVYCGGASVASRLYLNADTGETFRKGEFRSPL